MCRLRLLLSIPILALFNPVVFALADIPDLAWEDVEVVESAVHEVSSSSGSSVLFWEGRWWVVYEKSGEVYCRARDESGWLSPVQISGGAVAPRSVHLAGAEDLHVVWEDGRTGHPEVYTRRFNGDSWSAEQCVTCDGVASRGPAIAGEYGGLAVLVWEDSSGAGFRGWSSFFEYGGWGSPVELSTHAADAREPTVAMVPDWGWMFAAWSDYRHGDPEIYMRGSYGPSGWGAEERLTDLPEACRRPSAHTEICCGDAISETPFVAFEGTGVSGVPEAWVAGRYWGTGDAERVSADDGVPSIAPNTGGFVFPVHECGMGGGMARFFVTWTDQPAPGSGTHRLAYMQALGFPGEQEALPGAGLSRSAVGATEGNPEAGVMVLWVEELEGTPALMSRRGSLPGCYSVEMQAPASVILTPDGEPANYIRMVDACTGNPLEGIYVMLEFSSALDQALTWDPLQEHPWIEVRTDENGVAAFPIRGGGCSAIGTVTASCNWMPEASWMGAKSPDVDGDCRVTIEDLTYINMMMGTDDFCADLDGSGEVDAADAAIVSVAYGDHCSNVEAVEEPPLLPGGPAFIAFPNPARHATSMKIALATPAPVEVRIVDAGGRMVREFCMRNLPAGATSILWDLRDTSDRRVRSGVYFATARTGGFALRRPILILR